MKTSQLHPYLSAGHQTMAELLDHPNPPGLHPNEARWRDFARALLGAFQAVADGGTMRPAAEPGMRVLQLSYFKESGKWYEHGFIQVPESLTFFQVQTLIADRHARNDLPGVGGCRSFDVLCMGREHPEGYPFIDRANRL